MNNFAWFYFVVFCRLMFSSSFYSKYNLLLSVLATCLCKRRFHQCTHTLCDILTSGWSKQCSQYLPLLFKRLNHQIVSAEMEKYFPHSSVPCLFACWGMLVWTGTGENVTFWRKLVKQAIKAKQQLSLKKTGEKETNKARLEQMEDGDILDCFWSSKVLLFYCSGIKITVC